MQHSPWHAAVEQRLRFLQLLRLRMWVPEGGKAVARVQHYHEKTRSSSCALHIGVIVERTMRIRWAIIIICLMLATTVYARPQKGFHTGPYLQVVTGAVDSSFDRNLASNSQTGRDQEFAFGFLFGWHTSDHFGPFIQVRYSTDLNNESRLHIVNGNIGATYTLILDALTHFKSLRILPFAGGDLLFRIDALPVDPTVSSNLVNRYAVGPGVVGGVNFLFKRYIYIGAMFQEDFAYFYSKSQAIGGVPTTVYGRGWHPQWSASLTTGFHF